MKLSNQSLKKLESIKSIHHPGYARKLAFIIWVIIGLSFLILFVPWQQHIQSEGTIIALNPEDRPQVIPTVISGRVEKWYVTEGQNVKKGDTIVFLSEVKDKFMDPEMIQRLQDQLDSKQGVVNSSKNKSNALTRQISALKDAMQYSLIKAENKIVQTEFKLISDSMQFVADKSQLEIAKVQYDRLKSLYDQGLKSLTELEQRKLKLQESQAKYASSDSKLSSTRAELLNAKIELNSINAEYFDKISKAESEYNSSLSYQYSAEGDQAKIQNELQSTTFRNQFYYILAPQDGYVIKTVKGGIGITLKEGDAVVTIMPSKPKLAVELFIRAMDIPLVDIGEDVRLQFDGWPAMVFSGWNSVSFGTFAGTVKAVDFVSQEDGKYRLLVVPEEGETWPEMIRVGSGVKGWAMLNWVPVWYELWRQLNGFPPKPVKSSKYFDKHNNEEKE